MNIWTARAFETGGMRRTHLRHHENIAKRLLVHIAGFNLGLLMRKRFGVGKPRCLQGQLAALWAAFVALLELVAAIMRLPPVAGGADRVAPAPSPHPWLVQAAA